MDTTQLKDQLGGLGQTLRDRFNQLSMGQKVVVGTLALALVFSTIFLFSQTSEDYDVLYSNMSVPDAAATVAKLKEMKMPYKLADNGTTILVPRGRKNDLVLETANELTGDDTVSLTKIPPVAQGDVQKEWIRKMNTDAIAGVIESINGIKHAKVLVSLPEKSVFSDNEEVPSASVLLVVEPGFRLREGHVKTIKNLVSHAIPGLTEDRVVIADNMGNSLEGPGAAAAGMLQDRDLRRKKYESEIQKKILAILEPVVGEENAVVSVSAVMNFDHAEAQIHRVIPEGGTKETPTGVVVSAQEHNEEYTGAQKPGEGGAVGTETNSVPTYKTEDNNKDGDKTYKMTKKTTNFAHSEERKNIVYADGDLERLTVSVILNKVLTAKEQSEIKESVANAAGIDVSRGDSVDVKGFQFSQPPNSREKMLADAFRESQQQEAMIQYTYMGTILLLGLAAMFFLYRLLKQPAEGEIVEEEDDYEEEEEYPLLEELSQPQEEEEPLPELPALEAKLDPELEHMREAINGMIFSDPAEAARLLTAFMKESSK